MIRFIFLILFTATLHASLEPVLLSPLEPAGQSEEDLYGDAGAIKFTKGNLRGYKDKDGKVILPAKYEFLEGLNVYGIANAYIKGDWYKITLTGEKLAKCYFFDNGPDYFYKERARFIENNKVGF